MKTLKVIAACGNGMGSSQMIKMKIDKVFKKLGVEANIDHNSVGAATSMASNYDAVFVSLNFVDNFKNAAAKGTKIIGLKNLLSEKEIEEKILESGLVESDKESELVDKKDDFEVLHFFAKWCGPCQSMDQEIKQFEKEHPEVVIKHIDLDENENLAKQYNVMSIPTCILVDGEKELKRIVGYMDKETIEKFVLEK